MRLSEFLVLPGVILRLAKAHPCGSFEWRVTRVGADIGLACLGCGRRVVLPRAEAARRTRSIGPAPSPSA